MIIFRQIDHFLDIYTLNLKKNLVDKNLSWNSSNNSVAGVDSNGKVYAFGPGTATITVTSSNGNFSDSIEITVKTVPVKTVALSFNNKEVEIGSTVKLNATITPSNATNKNVTWTSSDTSIATVSSSGTVTAKKIGTAIITVTTVDGNYSDTCNIVVTGGFKVVSKKTSNAISVGDKYKIYNEIFYVVSSNSEKTVLFAESNLNVGYDVSFDYYANPEYTCKYNSSNIQARGCTGCEIEDLFHSDCYCTVPYSKGTGNYSLMCYPSQGEISGEKYNVFDYINNYKNILIEYGAPNSISARFITYEETTDLGCVEESCENAPSWLTSTDYWVGNDYIGNDIYCIDRKSKRISCSGSNKDSGVRPAIEVPTSALQ